MWIRSTPQLTTVSWKLFSRPKRQIQEAVSPPVKLMILYSGHLFRQESSELRFQKELAKYVSLKRTKLKLKRNLFLHLQSTKRYHKFEAAGIRTYCNLRQNQELGSCRQLGYVVPVETDRESLLFDTGQDVPLHLKHMKRLNIDPKFINKLVLSHQHCDHIACLLDILQANPVLKVYVPAYFLRT